MAVMPESMRLTEDEENQLAVIRKDAKKRHEKARRAARKRGRKDFPDLPFECSWAYEQQFRRKSR